MPRVFSALSSYLRGIGLMLLLIVAFDWGQAGEIRINNVSFFDAKSKVPSIVSLPLQINSFGKNGYYELEFPLPSDILSLIFPLRVVPHDCVSRIEVAGVIQELGIITRGDLCNSEKGFLLKTSFVKRFSGHLVNVFISDKYGQEVGLKLSRDPLLTFTQRVAISAFALCMLTLSLTTDWQGMRAACRRWLYIAALVLLLSWYEPELDAWMVWPDYMSTGIYVAIIVFLGAFWKPTRWVYERLESCMAQVLAIPDARFIRFAVCGFVLLTAFLSQQMFDGLPHVADTHIQYVQSKIFASGKLYEKSHPLRDFFEFQNAVNNGKYYAATFPGQPLLLAIGQIFHAPWLVNPITGGLTIWLVFLIACELAGKAAGCTAVALMFLSPMVVFMASEFMSHTPCMFFLMLFMYHYLRLLNTGDKKHAIIAGFAVGFALITRLQATVPFMAFIGIHALWQWVKQPHTYHKPMCCMVATFSIPLLFLLYFQYMTTGSYWSNGYIVKSKDNYPLLFMEYTRPSRWLSIGEDLVRLLEQVQVTQLELFGWPTSSLWGLLLFFVLRLKSKGAIVPLLSILGQYGCFMFVFRDSVVSCVFSWFTVVSRLCLFVKKKCVKLLLYTFKVASSCSGVIVGATAIVALGPKRS
jgi:hypothetical protein